MPETGGLIQLVTPLGTLNFNNYTDQNLLKIDEFQLTRDMRQQIDNAPQRDGAILSTFYRGPLHAMLKGTIWASDMPTRANLMDNLLGYLNSCVNATATLIWTPRGKTARQMTGRVLDFPSVDDASGALIKTFSFSLVSTDSVVYSTTQNSQDTSILNVGSVGGGWSFGTTTAQNNGTGAWNFGMPSPSPQWSLGTDPGGGSASITNSGNADSWPIIRMYGNAVAPKITHVQTGKYVSLPSYTIPTGQYAEIDMKNQTIRLNGSPSVTLLSYLDVANSQFFPLTAGAQSVRMSASSFDSSAKATVIWRDAWV